MPNTRAKDLNRHRLHYFEIFMLFYRNEKNITICHLKSVIIHIIMQMRVNAIVPDTEMVKYPSSWLVCIFSMANPVTVPSFKHLLYHFYWYLKTPYAIQYAPTTFFIKHLNYQLHTFNGRQCLSTVFKIKTEILSDALH